MRKITSSFLLASLFASSNALAATAVSGLYLKGFGGIASLPGNVNTTNYTNTKFRLGYDAGGSLGYKSGPVNYELEVSYVRANVKHFRYQDVNQLNVSGKSEAVVGMLNVFYNFEDLNPVLAPYLGVGIGYAYVKSSLDSTTVSTPKFSQANNVFSYQASVGLAYNFSENGSLDISYRYLRSEKAINLNDNFEGHLGNIGVTYRFETV